MSNGTGDEAIALHVYHAIHEAGEPMPDRIGGMVMVLAKDVPDTGFRTLVTAGASKLPVDEGLPVELAVEVLPGQEGAGMVALQIVCDDIATNHRTPPLELPWQNPEPFLVGTEISAIVATGSRWGTDFDEVHGPDGSLIGRIRTLRLLTDAEASTVSARGWQGLVEQAGAVERLLDVHRASTVDDAPRPSGVVVTGLHQEHPPRWLTLDGLFQSVTGRESEEYMADPANHQIMSLAAYREAFPFTAGFLDAAQPGQTAFFADQSGAWVLEE